MKALIFSLLLVSPLIAATPKKMVDKINSMKWDGESYTIQFNNFQRPVKISGKNENVPCLENAKRSNMDVLITIDSDIPMVKSCKLYSQSQPVTQDLQAQEPKRK